jgi:aryl-alcohol dehydrogenase-like predicted oxidoreductase
MGHMPRIPATELDVSPLCYGTATWGTAVDEGQAERLYAAYRQAGGNFFDTAHCYGFWEEGKLGFSERTLGRCIRSRGDSYQVVVATKGGHPDAGAAYRRPDRYISPQLIASDITESLDRLGLDRIDLYYLHRDDPRVPAGEIIDMLNAEIGRNRIIALGASNWSVARIAEANDYARVHGKQGFVASQPEWSLAHTNAVPPTADPANRYLMPADIAWHEGQKMAVVPYSSTARGYFATGGKAAAKTFDNPTSRARRERAEQLAGQLGVTPTQIALAWLMGHSFPVVPILGTTKIDHLKECLGAAEVRLTAQQVAWLAEG